MTAEGLKRAGKCICLIWQMIGLNDIKRSWLKDFQHSASHEIACTSIYIPIDELTFEQIFSSCLTLQTPHLGFRVDLRCEFYYFGFYQNGQKNQEKIILRLMNWPLNKFSPHALVYSRPSTTAAVSGFFRRKIIINGT